MHQSLSLLDSYREIRRADNLFSVRSWRQNVTRNSNWICMTPILLRSCTTPSQGRMQADFFLWQGQLGCSEMGFELHPSTQQKAYITFPHVRYRPRLDAASPIHILMSPSLSVKYYFQIISLASHLRGRCVSLLLLTRRCWRNAFTN